MDESLVEVENYLFFFVNFLFNIFVIDLEQFDCLYDGGHGGAATEYNRWMNTFVHLEYIRWAHRLHRSYALFTIEKDERENCDNCHR